MQQLFSTTTAATCLLLDRKGQGIGKGMNLMGRVFSRAAAEKGRCFA
jgi:hypothetical protein